jgi:hypothetical protein
VALGTTSQPWPLQEFCPAQAFSAVLHFDWPLQALMPMHLTSALPESAACAGTATVENKAAAAAARESLVVDFMLFLQIC